MKFQNISDSEFAERIMNSLPGIFYLYEKVGDQLLLRNWNNNHVKDLGYSHEELLNMSGSEFFTEQEFKRVTKAIEQVFSKGTTQIQTKIVTKSGKQIPYLLEAFSFVDNDRDYFMGVGIDFTSQLKIEKGLNKVIGEQEKLEQEKINIAEQLNNKKRELITTVIESGKTSKIIGSTINHLSELIENHSKNELYQELIAMRRNLEMKIENQDNWEIFKQRFAEVHEVFFDNLIKKHPKLTKNELKFCAYLHINLSSDQISTILNVSPHSIKKTRYRIRKKLGLKTKDSLDNYISKVCLDNHKN